MNDTTFGSMVGENDTAGCATVREMIPELVAGRVPAPAAAFVEAHVDGCADCRAELELVRLLYATRADAPEALLQRIGRVAVTKRPTHPWWGISAAAIAALALGIGFVSREADPALQVPAFAREAEEGEIWLSDDGLVAGAPALDDLSDEALLELLDELTTTSAGGAA